MDSGFAEVGGKLDTLIAKYEAAEQSRSQDRALADERHRDHEQRLRKVESRKTISPLQLWTVISGGALVVVAVVALFI